MKNKPKILDSVIIFRTKKGGLLEDIIGKNELLITDGILKEIKSDPNLEAIFTKYMKIGKIVKKEISAEDKDFIYKLYSINHGKEKAISYKKGRYRKDQGEFEAIVIARNNDAVFITIDSKAEKIASIWLRGKIPKREDIPKILNLEGENFKKMENILK